MSREGLFRSQVVDARSRSWLGHVRLTTPLSHTVWALVSVSLGTAITAWLLLGHYTRREHVVGVLVPRDGLIEVTTRSSATVERVLIHEGDRVRTGDLLAVLSGERVSEQLGATSASVSAKLRNQLDRIGADIKNSQTLASQQASALATQQAMLGAQIGQIDDQIRLQRQQLSGANALLEKIRPLEGKGYISAFQVQQQETAALDTEVQLKALLKQRLEAEQQRKALQDQFAQLPVTTDVKLNELGRQAAQVEQTLAQNEAERSIEMRAPADGVVSALLVGANHSVEAGSHLMSIVPEGSPLRAQVLVPSSSIGFLREGATVVLRYKAFPYQKFGLQKGHVASVSKNALSSTEIAALTGQPSSETYYRALVDLDRQSIRVYGNEEALVPGMQLDADVLLERRRIVEWLFEPLYGMRERAVSDAN
ncbi:HlyD family efflux transporter periplasmic adaptor subunit (plasmid) [Ralstonia solanacearum]|nr:HlyD family efflux transporter periplasmic adaptor subunit [Ralstonia solanacearum]